MIIYHPSDEVLLLHGGGAGCGPPTALGPDLYPSVQRTLLAFAVECERTIDHARLDPMERIEQIDDVERYLRRASYRSLWRISGGVILQQPGGQSLLLTEEHAHDLERVLRVAQGILR